MSSTRESRGFRLEVKGSTFYPRSEPARSVDTTDIGGSTESTHVLIVVASFSLASIAR